ncbi:hypothetical protein FIN93_19180 [Yersinia pestis]|nr:hypothetical protein FIN93_19180 [Yersinia pestis]
MAPFVTIYWMVRLPLGDSLLDGDSLFLIMRVLDFSGSEALRQAIPTCLRYQCNAGSGDTSKCRLSTSMPIT